MATRGGNFRKRFSEVLYVCILNFVFFGRSAFHNLQVTLAPEWHLILAVVPCANFASRKYQIIQELSGKLV